MQAVRNAIRRLKQVPLFARLNWQLYLLRDLWSSRIWTRITATTTPFGFTLFTRAHPAYKQMREGRFEPEETRVFQALLPMADAFIDIGANVGYYCCLALRGARPVVAFEPQAQNLNCLFRAIDYNGWHDQVEVFPLALGAAPGLLPLFGASGPSASLVKDWAGYYPGFRQTVAVNTLDHIICGRFERQQLIIKIDVEGAEYEVIRGAAATLGREPRPIWMLEVCFNEYHPAGVNPNYLAIFDEFFSRGYVCYAADHNYTQVLRADVTRWLASGVRDLATFNYVFLDANVPLRSLVSPTQHD